MRPTCERSIAVGKLLDYFVGELSEADEQELESHLFRCAACAEQAERVAGLATSVGRATLPFLSPSRFAELQKAGRVENVNPMTPGQTAVVRYPEAGRLLVHRFGGVDLSRARRIAVELFVSGGDSIARFEDVPFDPEHGEIFVACQSHFAETFPRDIDFSVEVENRPIARYTVHHRPA